MGSYIRKYGKMIWEFRERQFKMMIKVVSVGNVGLKEICNDNDFSGKIGKQI